MRKLFISQPMKNRTDEEILKERENAIKDARGCVVEHMCASLYGIPAIGCIKTCG